MGSALVRVAPRTVLIKAPTVSRVSEYLHFKMVKGAGALSKAH